MAKGKNREEILRFPPRSDWAYDRPQDGNGGAFAKGLPGETYRGASYTLELERDSEVPSNVRLPASIEIGTLVGSAARQEIRYESNRPVVTVFGTLFRDYRVEFSTNLMSWTPVLTTNSSSGRIVYTGPVAAGHRFYRTVLLE